MKHSTAKSVSEEPVTGKPEKTSTPNQDEVDKTAVKRRKQRPSLQSVSNDYSESPADSSSQISSGYFQYTYYFCSQKIRSTFPAKYHESIRKELSLISDDLLSKFSYDELEQRYFGFMSPEEILCMLKRRKQLDSTTNDCSLSSSFFTRPLPADISQEDVLASEYFLEN